MMPRFLLAVLLLCIGCKKKTEIYEAEMLQDYLPLQTGSVFIYQADSLVTKPNSSVFEKHSYQLKDSVESETTESGKRFFRIYRYIRDVSGSATWIFANAYRYSITTDQIQMTENNLTYIKLAAPIKETTEWSGNIFIDTKSPGSAFSFLDNWKYRYQNIGQSFTVSKGMMPNTITVLQADDTTPAGTFSPALDFQEKNYAVEVYAKNIGLIYREYFHYTWQKNPNPGFQVNSYGITLNLIDYKK